MLNINSDQDKLDILRKYYAGFGDASIADQVIKDPAQTQAVLNDIEYAVNRAMQNATQAVSRVPNAQGDVKNGNQVDMSGITAQSKKDSMNWLGGLQGIMSKYGQYLPSETISKYNGLTAASDQYLGTSFGQIQGGSGTPISAKDLISQAGGGAQQQGSISSQAKTLVDTALKNNQTTNLQSQPGWNVASQADRTAAYSQLQQITGSAQGMADYAKQNGLTNLQQYNWWNTSPYKQDAWNIISASGGTPVNNIATAGNSQNNTGTSTGGSTASGANNNTSTAPIPGKQAAIDYINSQDISADLKSMYTTIVNNWDPQTELNVPNIVQAFQKVKTETIDPYFQGLANQAIGVVTQAVGNLNKERALQMEQQNTTADQNIRNTQNSLEQSGMTFTGDARRQLGANSAYQSNGQAEGKYVFGSGNIEGLVPQNNRLVASSTEAAYQNSLANIGQQATSSLGSMQAGNLVAGYTPATGVEGNLATQKSSAYGTSLGNILNQQIANKTQGENTDYTKTFSSIS